MSRASLVRNMQEAAVGNRMIKGLINMVATGLGAFEGGDRILNSTPPRKIYRNTKSNNFAGWTFVATTVLITDDFSPAFLRRSPSCPSPALFLKKHRGSLVFDFWNFTPRSYGNAVCAVALSTHRRIDSTEALPHASSLGERPTDRVQLSHRSAFQSASLVPLAEL